MITPNNNAIVILNEKEGGLLFMKYDDRIEIAKAREYKVIKSNQMIQKARFELSVIEQKTIAYIISKIHPEDTYLKEYEFSIKDYCKVCGIDWNNGGNYAYIKATLKGLRDKSFWVTLEDGTETLCSWIGKVRINKRSGIIKIRLDDDIQIYLIGLTEKFTQYELLNTLPMRSQYSFRIYELLKSYSFRKTMTMDINELKKILMAENYINFKDFRKYVLEIALREINEYTDLQISYEPIKKGRKVIQVIFYIKERRHWDKWFAQNKAVATLAGMDKSVPGQMNIYDY